MVDTGFYIYASKRDRVAQPLPFSLRDGTPQSIVIIAQDVTFEGGGGAGGDWDRDRLTAVRPSAVCGTGIGS